MEPLRINPDLVTIANFAQKIGLSKQRLYQLWTAGKGPPRIDTGEMAVGRPRYLIPLIEGLRWHEERQSHLSDAQCAVAKHNRNWWAARNRTKQHTPESAQQLGEPEHPGGPSQIARSSVSPSMGEGQSEGTEARGMKRSSPIILRKSQLERALRTARREGRWECFAEGMVEFMDAVGITAVGLIVRPEELTDEPANPKH